MNQYHIRIDGEQSTDSYTYQELVEMGIFDLDNDSLNGIEVKKTTKANFTPLKSYCFLERQSSDSSYYVDEYGQIHRERPSQNSSNNGAYVDEYGQIVRPNNSGSDSSTNSSSTNTNTSSTGSTYSSNDDGWDTFWRVVGSIVVIGIVIAIIAGTGGIATPIAFGAAYALRAIWKDS